MGLNPLAVSEIFQSIQGEGRSPLRASGPKARESRAGRGTIGGWSGEPGRGARP